MEFLPLFLFFFFFLYFFLRSNLQKQYAVDCNNVRFYNFNFKSLEQVVKKDNKHYMRTTYKGNHESKEQDANQLSNLWCSDNNEGQPEEFSLDFRDKQFRDQAMRIMQDICSHACGCNVSILTISCLQLKSWESAEKG